MSGYILRRAFYMVIVLIVFSLSMAATYLFLIAAGQLPKLELVNAGLSLFATLFLAAIYPWSMRLSEPR